MTAPVGTLVAFDSHSPGISSAAGPWSHTIGSGNHRALIVAVFSFNEYSVPTYNGVAMTLLNGFLYNGAWPHRLYGMLDPPTGTHDVAFPAPNSGAIWAGSWSWSGVGSFGDASIAGGYANGTNKTLTTALGDAATFIVNIFAGSGVDTPNFAARGPWCIGSQLEESWGDPSVTADHADLGVNLVAYRAPSATTDFIKFF